MAKKNGVFKPNQSTGVVSSFKPFKKRWIAIVSFLICFVSVAVSASDSAGGDVRYWVTSERLNRRTCPSVNCGVVGQLSFRAGVLILERRDGWARVTKTYDASCVNGQSEYVDYGNNACDPQNGITDGNFAEWVSAKYLSEDRPADPSVDASGAEALIAGSDDFARYRRQFTAAAESLISHRRCTKADFRENGGWVKSFTHLSQPIYFIYCGGFTVPNRLYLNAETGEIFR